MLRVAYIGRIPGPAWSLALSGHDLVSLARWQSGSALRRVARKVRARVKRGPSTETELRTLALSVGAPLLPVADVNSAEFLAKLEDLRPDLIVCCGWSQKFGSRLLSLPRLGCVHIHP